MKYLFALLLTVNVVFYLWESRQGSAGIVNSELKLPPSAGERIVLIAELPSIPKKPAPPKPLAPPEPPPVKPAEKPVEPEVVKDAAPVPLVPACYWLGPYESDGDARRVLAALPAELKEAEVHRRSGEVPNGYWVLYPKAESMELARVNRQMLVDKGVRDLWVFDKGELQGAISLGLFTLRERAEAAAQQFRAQGIAAVEVHPRMVRNEAPWIKLQWPGDRTELERLIGVQGVALQACP
ncbi:hypothetical protein [Methylococcus sp. EFPC2]|uniref:hypothetical protein n=1 Tax=Methylococcus sp. EFPC2 TaxID=2812648 RepID=UPI0019674932|nr:hypothetical protein [Methylococcus sp. EFPC2]QSA97677.1 hypothetical protein JWZ97_02230 [Methylococcus sp. EFPC2]